MKLWIIVFFVFYTSCAGQKQSAIVKAAAFARASFPGIVSENNIHKGADTTYILYLEVRKNTNIVFDTAFTNNKSYQISSSIVPSPVTVGIIQDNADTAIVNVSADNILYQVNLDAPYEKEQRHLDGGASNSVILKVRINDTKQTLEIKPVKALQPQHNM